MSSRGRRAAALVTAVLAGPAIALAAQAAAAAPAGPEEVGKLRVTTSAPGMRALLSPGESHAWLLTAELEGAEAGTLSLAMQAAGDLTASEDGLWVILDECREEWTDTPTPTCAGESSHVVTTAASSVNHGVAIPLGAIRASSPRHLRLQFALPPDSPAELQDRSGIVGLGFTATGDGVPRPGATVGKELLGDGAAASGAVSDGQAGTACAVTLGTGGGTSDGSGTPGGATGRGATTSGDDLPLSGSGFQQCPVLSLGDSSPQSGIAGWALVAGGAATAAAALVGLLVTRRRDADQAPHLEVTDA
ncbi:hypothetical protein [Naasia sp. SYSU D00948]|uniref:hypothetical protein n=1 Tax=Naasia sp. SYSU D00948 TaxID=2817379 RepID=UPI001B30976B|nr:hypothetical protein [Naasia sp. SYSU D00948]